MSLIPHATASPAVGSDVTPHKDVDVVVDDRTESLTENTVEQHAALEKAATHPSESPAPLYDTDEQLPTLRTATTSVAETQPPESAGADTTAALGPPDSVSETHVEGMTVATSAHKRDRFRSLQVDVENDAQTSIPFPISQETFTVPSACYDDALVDGQKPCWRPGQPLRVAYVSWNLASREPFMPDVAAFCVRPNAHLVVVGTQENGDYLGSSKGQMEWAQHIGKDCLRDEYTLVSQTVMWALHLVVFARSRDVAKYVAHVHSSSVKTATKGMSGNKGGIAIGLSISMSQLVSTAYETVTSSTATSAPPNPLHEEVRATIRDQPTLPNSSTRPHDGTETSSALPDLSAVSHQVPSDAGDAEARPASAASHVTFLFVNAHLAAHQTAVADRNKGYARIVAQLKVGTHGKYAKVFRRLRQNTSHLRVLQRTLVHQRGPDMSATESEARPHTAHSTSGDGAAEVTVYQLPHQGAITRVSSAARRKDSSALKARDVTEAFDLTFFGGDLNYRLNGTKAALEKIIAQHKDIRSVLMYNDQLNIERQRGNVFAGYREGQLLFRPTYKYDIDSGSATDTYNTGKKQRLPAYCDRVLYKRSHLSSVRKVALRLYTDVRPVRTSDHKPVVALFDVDTEEYGWT